MNLLVTKTEYTPEDLLQMADANGYELVDGRLVEKHVSVLSSLVGGTLLRLLGDFCETHRLGWVLPADCGFQCFPDFPNRVRKPDVSFVRSERLTDEVRTAGHCPIAPDLAAEVVSPNDAFEDVDRKVEEYLRVGVRLVWVMCLATRQVYVHRPDGSVAKVREAQDLSGEDVVPGFRCRVGDLFPRLEEVATSPGDATPRAD